jgi:Dephospho-CoA kinase
MSEFKLKFGVILTGVIASGKSSVAEILRQKGYEIIDADAIAHEILQRKWREVVAHFGVRVLSDEILAKFGANLDKNQNNFDVSAFAPAREKINLNLDEILSTKKIDIIDRKALGAIVFSDKNELKSLENIVSADIKNELFSRADKLEKARICAQNSFKHQMQISPKLAKIKTQNLSNLSRARFKTLTIKNAQISPNLKPFFIEIPLFFERENEYKNLAPTVLIYTTREICLTRLMSRNSLTKAQAMARLNAQIPIEKKLEKANFIIENSANLEILRQNVEQFLLKLKANNENLKI